MIIRDLRQDDQQVVLDIYNFYVINTAYNFDIEPQTLLSKAKWFKQFLPNSSCQCLVMCNSTNQIVGFCYSSPFSAAQAYQSSVNIGFYICHKMIGQGIGNRLLATLLENLADQPIHKLFGGVTLPNERSKNLLLKHGFKYSHLITEVGYKFDRYWDVQWFERKTDW